MHEGKTGHEEEEMEVIRYEGVSILEVDLLVERVEVERMSWDVREGDKGQKEAKKGVSKRQRLFLQE